MNAPVRPQEELFPWEQPDQPQDAERVSAAPAAAPPKAQPRKRAKQAELPTDRPQEPEPSRFVATVEALVERAQPIAIETSDDPPTDPSDAGSADGDAFDFEAAAALLDRLEQEAGLVPVDTRERPAVAPREYYAISEVCDLVGLKPHVLRYWESQFPLLNPSKNRSGNRVYQRKEIKLILLVKHLLYDEKYTIEGAKAKMDRLRRGGELSDRTASAIGTETLGLLRSELDALYRLLTPREPA